MALLYSVALTLLRADVVPKLIRKNCSNNKKKATKFGISRVFDSEPYGVSKNLYEKPFLQTGTTSNKSRSSRQGLIKTRHLTRNFKIESSRGIFTIRVGCETSKMKV